MRRPSLRGISSLKRTNSINMSAINRTRYLVSQYSYLAGMIRTEGVAGRNRFETDVSLPLRADDEDRSALFSGLDVAMTVVVGLGAGVGVAVVGSTAGVRVVPTGDRSLPPA